LKIRAAQLGHLRAEQKSRLRALGVQPELGLLSEPPGQPGQATVANKVVVSQSTEAVKQLTDRPLQPQPTGQGWFPPAAASLRNLSGMSLSQISSLVLLLVILCTSLHACELDTIDVCMSRAELAARPDCVDECAAVTLKMITVKNLLTALISAPPSSMGKKKRASRMGKKKRASSDGQARLFRQDGQTRTTVEEHLRAAYRGSVLHQEERHVLPTATDCADQRRLVEVMVQHNCGILGREAVHQAPAVVLNSQVKLPNIRSVRLRKSFRQQLQSLRAPVPGPATFADSAWVIALRPLQPQRLVPHHRWLSYFQADPEKQPVVLKPLVLKPLVLKPLVLAPLVLKPLVLNPLVLKPMVLAPMVLAPLVLAPLVLKPMVLNPLVLKPMVLAPMVLAPLVLRAPGAKAHAIIDNATGPTGFGGATTTLPPMPTLTQWSMAQVAVLLLLFAFALMSNCRTLCIVTEQRKARNQPAANHLIQHLLVSDIFVAIFCLLGDALWFLSVEWIAGDWMCRLFKFLQCVALASSTFVTMAIAVDRSRAVTHPFSYGGVRQDRLRRRLLTGAWAGSCIVSLP
uniref:G_PROTEIN_RECEP_F1_2 domain-containing protein n=1 Tax=Macrostomum lignano TaxID=282301 RepID=A0A1I8JK42_9PLAT